jgi:hypothetical protein
MRFIKPSLVALLAVAGAASAGVAQARDHVDVQWSVTFGSGARGPVYAPPPVVVYPAPARVHVPAPVRVVYREPSHWDRDGDGIPNRHDRVYNPRWDVDGDGVPNRHDRVYNPRWDKDGDGVPNRYDRNDRRFDPPVRGYRDRDGDGVPNRFDPRPGTPRTHDPR